MQPKEPRAIAHIVVHCTGTNPAQVIDLRHLPYHFIVTTQGKLVNIRPVRRDNTKITIAWLGGMDHEGHYTDNRTELQKETLFNTLVLLAEHFHEAQIIGADQFASSAYPNPGFDVKKWLGAYIPAFLDAA